MSYFWLSHLFSALSCCLVSQTGQGSAGPLPPARMWVVHPRVPLPTPCSLIAW